MSDFLWFLQGWFFVGIQWISFVDVVGLFAILFIMDYSDKKQKNDRHN
jgi:general stress protein CsbA